MRVTAAKIGLHAGNMKLSTKNDGRTRIRIIVCMTVPVFSCLYVMCNKHLLKIRLPIDCCVAQPAWPGLSLI